MTGIAKPNNMNNAQYGGDVFIPMGSPDFSFCCDEFFMLNVSLGDGFLLPPGYPMTATNPATAVQLAAAVGPIIGFNVTSVRLSQDPEKRDHVLVCRRGPVQVNLDALPTNDIMGSDSDMTNGGVFTNYIKHLNYLKMIPVREPAQKSAVRP